VKTFEFGKRFSRIRVHEQRRHAETAQANEAGNRSGSYPFIQRAISFDLKECRSRRSSPALFASGGVGNSGAGNRETSFSIPARKPQAGCAFMKNARIAHKTW
jgi:hypothetical protein